MEFSLGKKGALSPATTGGELTDKRCEMWEPAEIEKARGLRSGPFLLYASGGNYSAGSTAFVCETVQSGAPTLKRAKRRTVMFSPNLPTFCAISSLMLMA